MPSRIIFQIDNHTARLILNSPPLNILNLEIMAEIAAALESLQEQPNVRVLVIEAVEGSKAFSAGVDVADHTADKVREMIARFHHIFRLLAGLNIPTLAVVNGAALGGGCELAIFCDMIVASERAKFGQPEIKVGVFPPIAAVVLPRLIPARAALELLLTGETIAAAEAHRLGLVNRLAPPQELAAAAAELTGKLAGQSGAILRYTRRATRIGEGVSFEQALRQVEHLYLEEMMQAHDAHEGLAAFMEKRPPLWQDK